MSIYACGIPIRNGKLLLGRRADHRKLYPRCWDVIGGKVEAGETIEMALIREASRFKKTFDAMSEWRDEGATLPPLSRGCFSAPCLGEPPMSNPEGKCRGFNTTSGPSCIYV
jgi:NUDIX domain